MPEQEGAEAVAATGSVIQKSLPEMPTIPGLVAGRVVYYRLPNDAPGDPGQSDHVRPAIVVRVWDWTSGCANLQVFLDGTHDPVSVAQGRCGNLLLASSALYDENLSPGTWRFVRQTHQPYAITLADISAAIARATPAECFELGELLARRSSPQNSTYVGAEFATLTDGTRLVRDMCGGSQALLDPQYQWRLAPDLAPAEQG